MELVISAVAGKSNTWYLLSDKDNSPLQHHLFTHAHLPANRESEWFQPVVGYDRSGALTGITNNQLMVVLYFYLNDNSRSATIMKQWLLDAGCNEAQAESLTETIYLARLDKDGSPDELISNPAQENTLTYLTQRSEHKHPAENNAQKHAATKLALPVNTLKQTTLSEMLSSMGDGTGISWSFDLLPFGNNNNNNNNNSNTSGKSNNNGVGNSNNNGIGNSNNNGIGNSNNNGNNSNNNHKVLNLSTVEETAILIEDHHCIIAGYTVDMTSFTELICGENETLAGKLSAMVPLHLRDHYSAGRLFIKHPHVEALLLANRFSSIEHYGLESTGLLKQFSGLGFPLSHKSPKSHLSHKPTLLPLPFYLKLIKKP